MTDERLAEIKAREAKATPGPWQAFDTHGTYRDQLGDKQPGWWIPEMETLGDDVCSAMLEQDAVFVANARADIPYLLARADRLAARVAELEAAGDRMAEAIDHFGDCGWAKHKLGQCGDIPWEHDASDAWRALAAPLGDGEGA